MKKISLLLGFLFIIVFSQSQDLCYNETILKTETDSISIEGYSIATIFDNETMMYQILDYENLEEIFSLNFEIINISKIENKYIYLLDSRNGEKADFMFIYNPEGAYQLLGYIDPEGKKQADYGELEYFLLMDRMTDKEYSIFIEKAKKKYEISQ